MKSEFCSDGSSHQSSYLNFPYANNFASSKWAQYRLLRSGVFLTSFVRVQPRRKTCFRTTHRTLHHLMGNFSLAQSLKSRQCVITGQKTAWFARLSPSALYIWPTPSYRKRNDHLLNNSRCSGTSNSRLTSTVEVRGRGGSDVWAWESY